jgi:hypothetical protein
MTIASEGLDFNSFERLSPRHEELCLNGRGDQLRRFPQLLGMHLVSDGWDSPPVNALEDRRKAEEDRKKSLGHTVF